MKIIEVQREKYCLGMCACVCACVSVKEREKKLDEIGFKVRANYIILR